MAPTNTTNTTSSQPRPSSISFQTPQESLRQAALKKKMSITQTYYLAHKARAKLSHEAAQPDHDLRLLVGHANLLDSLMFELADAEREQERWFNQSVRGATTSSSSSQKQSSYQLPQQQERHVRWNKSIITEEEEEEDDDEDEYDSDSSDEDYYEEEDEDDALMTSAMTPILSRPSRYQYHADDNDDIAEDDLEEDYAQLELVRTPSHSNSPTPELVDESDSSDDESAMPPSPPTTLMLMPEEDKKDNDQESESLFEEEDNDYFLPQRSGPTNAMVAPIPVY